MPKYKILSLRYAEGSDEPTHSLENVLEAKDAVHAAIQLDSVLQEVSLPQGERVVHGQPQEISEQEAENILMGDRTLEIINAEIAADPETWSDWLLDKYVCNCLPTIHQEIVEFALEESRNLQCRLMERFAIHEAEEAEHRRIREELAAYYRTHEELQQNADAS